MATRAAIEASPDPDPSWTQLLMGIHLELDQPDEALRIAEELAARDPSNKRTQLNLASIYLQNDRKDRAAEVLNAGQRVALWRRERVEAAEERPRDVGEPGERKARLALGASRGGEGEAGRSPAGLPEQRRLARTRLADERQRPTRREESLERLELAVYSTWGALCAGSLARG